MVPNVDASKLMKLNLTYDDTASEFTLSITNTSGGTMNETPFSPGVWAVSNILGGKLLNEMPFYKAERNPILRLQLLRKAETTLLWQAKLRAIPNYYRTFARISGSLQRRYKSHIQSWSEGYGNGAKRYCPER